MGLEILALAKIKISRIPDKTGDPRNDNSYIKVPKIEALSVIHQSSVTREKDDAQ